MRIEEPGKITERIEFLGTREICLYLVTGRDAMIVGGGMAYVAPALEQQLSGIGFERPEVKYLVVTHSHFDHCGAVPYLRQRFPKALVLGSGYAAEVFSKAKVADFIAGANRAMVDATGMDREYEQLGPGFDGIRVDRVVADNDAVNLGDGVEVRFLETRGHTKCSLAAYIPELKAMFPSDAAPCPLPGGKGTAIPSPQYDFRLYMESLRRLAVFDIEICAFEHFGVMVGDKARSVLKQGLQRTERVREYVLKQYREMGDADKVAEKLVAEIRSRNELPFLSSELQADVTRTVVRKILAA